MRRIKATFPALSLAGAPHYISGVNRAVTVPDLNGKGQAVCWENIPALELTAEGHGAIKENGFAKLLWDDQNLYVFIWARAINMALRKKDASKPDNNIWLYDCLEIFIDPGRTRKDYYHLAGNCLGKTYAASAREGKGFNTAWASGWKTAVDQGPDFWTFEAAIPFGSLGVNPRAGSVWGFNVVRANQGIGETSAWQPTLAVHHPDMFGRMIFLGPECLAGVRRAQSKAQGALVRDGNRRLRQANAELRAACSHGTNRKYFSRDRFEVNSRIARCKKTLASSSDFAGIYRNSATARALLSDAQRLCARIEHQRSCERLRASLFGSGSVGALRGYAVCVESAMSKISAEDYSGSSVKTVRLHLAGREFGSFQLAVLTKPGRRLTGVSIGISRLADRHGRPLDQARIDACRVDYIRTARLQPNAQETIPDVLWPGQQFKFKQPVGMADLWFDVYLPPDVPPGTYRAVVCVMPDHCQATEIPITVEALPFSLPLKATLSSAFCFVDHWAEDYYRGKMSREKRHAFFQFILDHRLEPMSLWARGRLEMSEEDLDWAAERGKSMLFLKVERVKDSAQYYRDLIERFRGRLKPVFFGYDEVLMGSPEKLAGMQADYKLAREKFPNVPRLNTSEINAKLYGYVNTWCPLFNNYAPVHARQRQLKGERVWWYTTDYPRQPYANFNLDSPGIDPRIIPWMNWKLGISGLLYWGLNREWLTNSQEAERLTGREKEMFGLEWMTPRIREKMKKGLRWPAVPWAPYFRSVVLKDSAPSLTNGGGNLMYPGPDWRPLSSIRLKNLRDGMQDYEYFAILAKNVALLKRRGGRRDLIVRSEKALKIDNRVVAGAVSYTKDPAALSKARRELAGLIVRTLSELKKGK